MRQQRGGEQRRGRGEEVSVGSSIEMSVCFGLGLLRLCDLNYRVKEREHKAAVS